MAMIFGLLVLVQALRSGASGRSDMVDVVAVLQDPVQLNGAWGIAIEGGLAYVASQFDDGVTVLDITDPTSPTLAGSIKDRTILDYASGIAIRGAHAFVGTQGYFVSISIADPSNMTIVSSVHDSFSRIYGIDQVVLDGNYAYVASQWGSALSVIDITDPSNLTLAGTLHVSSLFYGVRGIDIVGDRAYLCTNNGNIDFAVVDISDPSNPSLIGTLSAGELEQAARTVVVGSYAYVTGMQTDSLVVVGSNAYVSTRHGVVTVDISDPSSPTILGTGVQITDDPSDSDTDAYAKEIAIVGNHAYVACNSGFMHRGMAVVDISTPSNLREVSFFGENPKSFLEDAHGVKVDGNYAYVVGDEGSFTVIDISNPRDPQLVSTIFDMKMDGAEGLAVSGDYAYVAANSYDGFVAVHIADKANLAIDLFDGATDVAIAGNYAFVTAYSEDAVTAVDISNPNNLTVASHFKDSTLDGAENIVIVGNLAYVTAYSEDSLTILNIADPYNISLAGTIRDDRLEEARGLAVVGDYAYVACHDEDGFAAIHIADPSNLTIVGQGTQTSLRRPAVDGNHAFVTSEDHHSVTMIDISDPSNLTIVGNWQHPSLRDSRGIAIAGAYAYVTGYDSDSFLVFSIDTTTTTTVITNTMTTVTTVTSATATATETVTMTDAMTMSMTTTVTNPVTGILDASYALHKEASAFALLCLPKFEGALVPNVLYQPCAGSCSEQLAQLLSTTMLWRDDKQRTCCLKGVPKTRVDQLFRTQLFHDRKQYEERRSMSADYRAKAPVVDSRSPRCA
ncbi:unnamed protein product [Symbiodinium sp. CCMP2592]|nr:unnamed protein product [Symbiodinium sp. CCMP2592]